MIVRKRFSRHHFNKLVTLALIIATATTYASVFLASPSAEAITGQWAPTTLTKIADRNGTSCAIADGKVYCWGQNTYGQLGNGSTTNTTTPTPVYAGGVLAGKTVTDIGVGSVNYVCVIASGAPYCWGHNNFGQLGNGSTTDSPVPVAVDTTGVLNGKTVTAIATGDAHACVIADGQPYCWGVGGNGRLGNSGSGNHSSPVAVTTTGVLAGTTTTGIEAGSAHVCVVASGQAYCWGANSLGQLGNNSTTDSNAPVAVDTTGVLNGKTISSVNTGSSNSTACVVASGAVFCWGSGATGVLGNNSTANSSVPVAADTSGALAGKTIVQISEGNQHTCAIDSTGAPYCWGAAPVGTGSASAASVPIAIAGYGALAGVTAASIVSGDVQCVVGTNNRAYCWGYSATGAIGDGTTSSRATPVVVISNDGLTNANYRFYQNANSLTPGNPLAANNIPVQLATANDAFRLRYGVREAYTSNMTIDIRPSDATFKLQYAARTATYCDGQTTGFADISTSTPIAWNINTNASNGAQISQSGSDPRDPAYTNYQTYQSAAGNLVQTNTIQSGNNGTWDFSLRDNHAPSATDYCLRIVMSDGTPLDSTLGTPMITTAAAEMDVGVVDAAGNAVTSPVYSLGTTIIKTTCQTVTGTLGTLSQQIQAYNNLSTTGWSLSIADYPDPSGLWKTNDGTQQYDFNDPSGSPAGCNSGSDGDGYAGQLTINPSGATISSPNGCSSTGISLGSATAFNQNVTDSITIGAGSSSTPIGCRWNFTGIGISQTIPANQPAGAYSLGMMMTVVAQ